MLSVKSKGLLKTALLMVMSVLLTLGVVDMTKASMRKEVTSSTTELPAEGEFNVIAEPFEWGKDVTRLLIHSSASFNKADISGGDFSVYAEHYSQQAYKNDTAGDRKVIDAYPVDTEGNKVEDSDYIVVELEYGKNVQAAHTGSYNYANYYTPLTPRYTVTCEKIGELVQNDVVNLVCDEFMLARYTDNTIENADYNFVDYAFYAPKSDAAKKPLIIFFHGMGEGGGRTLKNQGVQMYAYQEEYFSEKEIQDIMGGSAYVLLPQSPDQWPTDGFTGESKYLQVLTSLIDSVISENPDIDTDRIYIGGLSMGGFMASRMIINYPDKFAAAFLCSQAYAFTAEDAEKLKNLPIWISCSEKDGTCAMDPYTFASYQKLVDAGSTVARCAVMKANNAGDLACRYEFFTPASDEPVVYYVDSEIENTVPGDMTWNNDTYGGHEAGWIHVFNNHEYYVDENNNRVSIMEWVAEKNRTIDKISVDASAAKKNYGVGEAISKEGLVVTATTFDGQTLAVSDYTLTADTSVAGEVTVTVNYVGKTATYKVTVGAAVSATPVPQVVTTPAPITTQIAITMSATSAKLLKNGDKLTLKAEATGSNEAIVWTSSNSKVATVNSKGVVTSKSAGKATITATIGGVSAKCNITVVNAKFKIAKLNITVKKGKKAKIKVTVSPKKKVKFKSSSKKIVKVNSKGVIVGVKKGTAKITVTYNGFKKIVKVKVK